jgi:hypothetical protein
MHGLPTDFDFNVLIGHLLELLCFSQNTISLNFSGDVMITIEGGFSYSRDPTNVPPKVLQVPVVESDVMALLGQTITKASGDERGTLTLEFGNGARFMCYDDSTQFESYHIVIGDKEIHV